MATLEKSVAGRDGVWVGSATAVVDLMVSDPLVERPSGGRSGPVSRPDPKELPEEN